MHRILLFDFDFLCEMTVAFWGEVDKLYHLAIDYTDPVLRILTTLYPCLSSIGASQDRKPP